MSREISLDRHKARLLEDPAYKAQFADLDRPVREDVKENFSPKPKRISGGPRIAVVIPTYSIPNPQNWCNMAADTATGWKDQCHDLIISEDGDYCAQLHDIADVYIMHPRYWPAENMNIGWQLALARGADFVAIMDSDVKFSLGSLRELCIPGQVTVPTISQHPGTVTVAPMLVVPKEITEQIGMYDSAGGRHALYWFDNNFQARLQAAQIPLVGSKSLVVWHEGGSTTRFLNGERPPGSPIS